MSGRPACRPARPTTPASSPASHTASRASSTSRSIRRLERDEALDLLPDLTTRTLVLVSIETGLRAIDARTLTRDCLSTDPADAPYLRYFNHKLVRERFLPISPRLAEQLCRQQAAVRERFPDGEACLLPRERRNPDGRHPYPYDPLVDRLHVWVAKLDVRDANGQPVTVTPHRFRHTLAYGLDVGTRIVAESESTDRQPRPGVIEEVLRGDPSPRYRIRWDDGHESIYTPASGALRAEHRGKTSRKAPRKR